MRIPLSDAHKAYLEELLPAAGLEPDQPAFADESVKDRLNGILHKGWKLLLAIVAAIVAPVTSLQAAVPDPRPETLLSFAGSFVTGPGAASAANWPEAPSRLPPGEHPVAFLPRSMWGDGSGRPRKRGGDQPSSGLGIATHKGQVRSRNEDAGASLDLEDVRVVLLADGLGGEPFGDVASLCAIEAAITAFGCLDGHTAAGDPRAAEAAIRNAFAAAETALAERARELDIAPGKPGLRTTLLIALASRDCVVFGQIGDGAIVIVRDGAVIPLITAQKADPDRLSMLAACLGPSTLRSPVFGVFERRPGDVLIAATDGVADRVTDAFYAQTAIDQIAARGGDLELAATDILESLAGYRHEGETVFDDNMTLALIADRPACRDRASFQVESYR